MNFKKALPYAVHLTVLTLALMFLGYIIHSFSLLFFYILCSLLLAAGINTYFDWMRTFGIDLGVSSILLLTVFLIGVMGFFLYIVPGIVSDVSMLQANVASLQEGFSKSLSFLPESVVDEAQEIIYGSFKGTFLPWFAGISQNFLEKIIGALIIIPILTFMLMKDASRIKKMFFTMLPNRYFEISLATFDDIVMSVKRFLLAKIVQFFILFIASSTLFLFLGFPMPILLGFLIGALNIIPYFGPLLGIIPPVFVAVLSEQQLILPALSVVIIAQIIDNFVLQPILLPSLIAEPPLVVVIVTLVGATLGGPIGMIVAVPVYSILKSVYLRYYQALRILYAEKRDVHMPMISW